MYYFYAVAQDGEPALVLAIKHARVDLVKELLRRGANVNATSQVRPGALLRAFAQNDDHRGCQRRRRTVLYARLSRAATKVHSKQHNIYRG